MWLTYQQRGAGECSEWHDARGALYVALLDCDTSMLLVSQERVTRRKMMLLRQRRVCPQIITHEQSSPVGLLAQDSRGRPLDSMGFKKWPLERERRAHQPQPLKLPQRPLNPVLYLGHHQETCARSITRSALLAELLQAAAALPR